MARDGFGREALAQPLVPTAAAAKEHPLRDWTERTRTTALQALRYSRFVAFMKRALPIAAVAVVAAVIAYSLVPRGQDRFSLLNQRVGNLRNDLAMTKPRLTGTDARGNPFVITADAAIQDPTNRHRATLKQVQADMQFDGERWLNASADTGLFDMDTGTLKLSGDIALYSDSGYELHTKSADADLRKNIFWGKDAVTGHGPLGSLSADSFKIDRLKRQLKLSGHVHMIMYPKEAKR